MTSSYNSITGTDSANTLIGSTGSDSFSALTGDDNVLGAQGGDIVDLGLATTPSTSMPMLMGQLFTAKVATTLLGITVSFNTSTM